jgi:hypothetical protein
LPLHNQLHPRIQPSPRPDMLAVRLFYQSVKPSHSRLLPLNALRLSTATQRALPSSSQQTHPLDNPPYPRLIPPSMELPLPSPQPVTRTPPTPLPTTATCHPACPEQSRRDRRAAPFAARSGGTLARSEAEYQFGRSFSLQSFFLYLPSPP